VTMEGAGAHCAARHFATATPPGQLLVDDIDGALVVLCSATVAADVRRAISTWMRQELRAAHRGVVSRPVARAAEIPPLYAMLRRALTVLARIGVQSEIVGQDEL